MSKVDTYTERGLAFLEGNGVAKDYEQAFYWLSVACELGSDIAGSKLRDMRRMSLGTPFDGSPAESTHNPSVTDEQYSPSVQDQTPGAITIVSEIPGIGSMHHVANPNRCVACGMETLVASPTIAGAKYCSPHKGGCGTTLMIPIIEYGLDRGLAMQPYREGIPGRRGNTYSSLGALVHMIKYDTRMDDTMRAGMIAETVRRIQECGVIEQVAGGMRHDLVIVPAPSSKRRRVQPVYLLAQLISQGGYGFDNALMKRSTIESKNRPRGTELAPSDVRCNGNVYGKAILLVDDTYGEGATLRACIRALRENGAREVYFLSLCKNIFGGMKGSPTDDHDIH